MSGALLEQVFAACKPRIDALAKAGREKLPSTPLAIMLEHRTNGQLVGGCAERTAAIAQIESSRLMHEPTRRTIVEDLSSAPATQIPVVLVVHTEGDPEVGVWRLTPPAPKAQGFHVDDEQSFARLLAAHSAHRDHSDRAS